MASSPAASIPAPTASLLSAYSCVLIDGRVWWAAVAAESVVPANAPARKAALRMGLTDRSLSRLPLGEREPFLVGGKLFHRLRDLLRVGHVELFLRGVEGHRRQVWGGDPHDRAVEVFKRVLGDDRRDLRTKTSGQVVLVDHHRLAGFAHRLQDGVAVQRNERPQVDDLDADAITRQLLGRLEAVVGHKSPCKGADVCPAAPDDRRPVRYRVVAGGDLLGDEPVDLLVLEKQHRVWVPY